MMNYVNYWEMNIMANKYMKYKKNNTRFVQPTAYQMECWFRANGIEYRHGRGDQFRICNPDGDTKFCVEVSKTEALVHDFRPNHQQYDGSFIRFVSRYKGISIQEAISEVCGKDAKASTFIKRVEEPEEVEDEISLPSGSLPLRNNKGDNTWKLVMSYLTRERSLDREAIMQANIHYLGTTVVVPYYEYDMIVFWQMRQQLSKRFEFPPSSTKNAGDFLYGFDNVEPHSFVIITESIFNTLSIGPDCVATGGAKLKDGQIRLLQILSPSKIILAPDNDDAGVDSLIKDYMNLRKGSWEIWYCLPPYDKDEKKQMDWNDMKRSGLDPRSYVLSNMKKMSMLDAFSGIDRKIFK